jgi:hypothetical protein
MSFSGSASTGSYFGLAGILEQYWTFQGDASAGPVPATITTLGNLQGSITAHSLSANRRVEVSADWLGMKIATNLNTYEGTSGLVQRRDGLRTSGVFGQASGKWLYPLGSSTTSDLGGSASASGSGSFNTSFELFVTPHAVNRIVMQLGAGLADGGYLSNNPSAFSYSFDLSGYVNPVITVGAAFASHYSVLQSAIPMGPVPEAPALAMRLSGLALMAGMVHRKK